MAGWIRLRGTLQVRPCKLGRRIHAAHAPATGPTPPSTDFRDLSERHGPLLVGVDLGRHSRSTPWVDAFRSRFEIFDSDGDSSTMAWIHQIAEICQGGAWAGRTVGGMDAAIEPPWMGLRRVLPACPCRPANPRNANFCCCRCLGLKHLQVQGAALPKNTHKKTAGRGLLFRCNGAPGEIRTPDRLVRSQVLYPTELRAPIT